MKWKARSNQIDVRQGFKHLGGIFTLSHQHITTHYFHSYSADWIRDWRLKNSSKLVQNSLQNMMQSTKCVERKINISNNRQKIKLE